MAVGITTKVETVNTHSSWGQSCPQGYAFRMNLGERIEARLAEKGWSQAELARRVGVSQQTIWKLVTGASNSTKHLREIARHLGTSEEYLLGETDDPAPTPAAAGLKSKELIETDDKRVVQIPVIDLAYGMGGTYLEDVDPEASLEPFPLWFIRRYTKAKAEDLVIAEGVGDSMAPTIGSSDQLLIDRSVNSLRIADKVWAFSFGGLGMVKRLRARGDGSIAILSDNPLVPEDRAVDDELFIIGQVVGVMKKL